MMILLDGKDVQGSTKYLNEDGTKHTRPGSSYQQQPCLPLGLYRDGELSHGNSGSLI